MRTLPKSLLVVLATLLAAVPVAAMAGPEHHPRRPLIAITYNIHHAQGEDGVLDLERIARVIEDSGAGLVGLQEVDRHFGERSDWVDQAAWLAQRLKMQYRFAPNLDLPPAAAGQPRRQYGTAILSRYPIRDFRNTLLPLEPGGEQRGLAVATLRVDGRDLRFANTHLTHQDADGRQAQARKVVEVLGRSQRPTLLVGDLNAVAGTPELRTLTSVWRDTWPQVGVGPGNTIRVDDPTSRIDYLLHTATLRPTAARVISTRASDHLPVVATYTLR